MIEIIELMNKKNRLLENILDTTMNFLVLCENNIAMDINNLPNLRENDVREIFLCDKEMHRLGLICNSQKKDPKFIEELKALVSTQKKLFEAIILADEKILQRIDEEKSRILKEVSISDRKIETVVKFKSKWVPECGEKLDGKV